MHLADDTEATVTSAIEEGSLVSANYRVFAWLEVNWKKSFSFVSALAPSNCSHRFYGRFRSHVCKLASNVRRGENIGCGKVLHGGEKGGGILVVVIVVVGCRSLLGIICESVEVRS